MRTAAADTLLRTLAFHRTWGHAPTRAEWIATLDVGSDAFSREETESALSTLVESGSVAYHAGRFVFASDGPEAIDRIRENEFWAARKYRVAHHAASWLSRLGSVRFVALCNTAALGHARDGSDLDLFVVTRKGTVSATRVVSAMLFELLGRRPKPGHARDAICLSYFVAEDGLDLSGHMLTPDDPYFRFWFLSLVPLYDDGVGQGLWDANRLITSRHPFSRTWMVPPDLRVPTPRVRVPIPTVFERLAERLQAKAFPDAIRRLINQDTRVMVSPTVLKFHVDDRRESYRQEYQSFCMNRGIAL